MASFIPRRKYSTIKPALKVEPGLPAGTYRFELVVTDENGNQSKGSRQIVKIFSAKPRTSDCILGDGLGN